MFVKRVRGECRSREDRICGVYEEDVIREGGSGVKDERVGIRACCFSFIYFRS